MNIGQEQLSLFKLISTAARKLNTEVYLVGGVLRDLLQGKGINDRDLDFSVAISPGVLAREILPGTGGQIKEFEKFHTAKIISPSKFASIDEFDLAQCRQEVYVKPGALPKVSPASITQDLSRRDFSINAMALEISKLCEVFEQTDWQEKLAQSVVDLFGGLQDLKQKKIRVLHSASFIDDPTRIFRACRYAIRISGKLEEGTEILARQAVDSGALETISDFRLINELKKILVEKNSSAILDYLFSFKAAENLKMLDAESWLKLHKYVGNLDNLGELINAAQKVSAFIAALIAYEKDDLRISQGLGISKKAISELQQAWQLGLSESPIQDNLALVIRAAFHNNEQARSLASKELLANKNLKTSV